MNIFVNRKQYRDLSISVKLCKYNFIREKKKLNTMEEYKILYTWQANL